MNYLDVYVKVKAVATTSDASILVSASSDCTLKVWNMQTERLLFTLKGHTDEVIYIHHHANTSLNTSISDR